MIIIGQINKSDIYSTLFQGKFKEEFVPNYNIQQGDKCHVLTTQSTREFVEADYGLIPFWSKERAVFNEAPIDGGVPTEPGMHIKNRLIHMNAFRKPIRETRCIIPADYIVLIGNGSAYLFFNQNKMPMAIAGVYDTWKAEMKDKELYRGFAPLTFPSYGIFAQLSIERVPYIIPGDGFGRFLFPTRELLSITGMIQMLDDRLVNGFEVDYTKVIDGLNDKSLTIPKSNYFKPLQSNGNSLLALRKRKFVNKKTLHDDDKEPGWWGKKKE